MANDVKNTKGERGSSMGDEKRRSSANNEYEPDDIEKEDFDKPMGDRKDEAPDPLPGRPGGSTGKGKRGNG
jgi:hypothetical protein